MWIGLFSSNLTRVYTGRSAAIPKNISLRLPLRDAEESEGPDQSFPVPWEWPELPR